MRLARGSSLRSLPATCRDVEGLELGFQRGCGYQALGQQGRQCCIGGFPGAGKMAGTAWCPVPPWMPGADARPRAPSCQGHGQPLGAPTQEKSRVHFPVPLPLVSGSSSCGEQAWGPVPQMWGPGAVACLWAVCGHTPALQDPGISLMFQRIHTERELQEGELRSEETFNFSLFMGFCTESWIFFNRSVCAFVCTHAYP